MATISDFTASGRILAVNDHQQLVFAPIDTNYRLHLQSTGEVAPATIGQIIRAEIRARAVKVYTIATGGGFISPIFGPPRVVQGRVVYADLAVIVVRAGTHVTIELPTSNDAIDLANGPITIGSMINAVLQIGASIRPVKSAR